MAKKPRKSGKKAATSNPSRPASPRKRRNRIKAALVFVALCLVTAAGLAAYKMTYDVEHDISVIGNGTPTVVQVHDPSCKFCQKLKTNVGKASGEFKGKVQFRIASLRTSDGQRLSREYNVGKVTLLLFDGEGKHKDTIEGVQTPEYLARRFSSLTDG